MSEIPSFKDNVIVFTERLGILPQIVLPLSQVVWPSAADRDGFIDALTGEGGNAGGETPG